MGPFLGDQRSPSRPGGQWSTIAGYSPSCVYVGNLLCSFQLVWPVPLAQVLPHPRLIFPSKTWFFGIYLGFQWQKSIRNQYLPHSESKSYQINSIKSLLIKIFPTAPKAHSNSSQIFSYDLIKRKNHSIFKKLLQHTSKPHGTKPMHRSSSRAFQRHQEHDLKHPSAVDLITTKQNKLPFFIGR
jgi:hypothetical protein